MPLAVPSLLALCTRVRDAFRAYLPGTDAYLRPNNLDVTAKVVGGGNQELMGRIDYVADQAFVSTCADATLDTHGAEFDLPRKPAQLAAGTAIVVAADALLVPAGTVLFRSDGVGYAATADRSLAAAGSLSVPVLALAAGANGNAVPGTPLVLGAGSTSAGGSGLDPSGPGAGTATVSIGPAGVSGGAEVEGPAPYRARLLFRKANPPRGGAPSDYVIWAGAVPGVTRVFVERLYKGPGSIRVYPLFDEAFPGGVGDAPHLEAVVAALAPVVPAGADWAVGAARALPIDVVLSGLKPLTRAVENAIAAELVDTFRRRGAVSGTDAPVAALPFLAVPQVFSRSWIAQAVANATGEQRHRLLSPADDVVVPAGFVPVPGRIAFS